MSLLGAPVAAGTITQPSAPDPLLDGGPTSACAAGVDYAPAIDATGNAVVPADVAAHPVPVPGAIAIPLGSRSSHGGGQAAGAKPYISLDGHKLEPLLNPPPCSTKP